MTRAFEDPNELFINLLSLISKTRDYQEIYDTTMDCQLQSISIGDKSNLI